MAVRGKQHEQQVGVELAHVKAHGAVHRELGVDHPHACLVNHDAACTGRCGAYGQTGTSLHGSGRRGLAFASAFHGRQGLRTVRHQSAAGSATLPALQEQEPSGFYVAHAGHQNVGVCLHVRAHAHCLPLTTPPSAFAAALLVPLHAIAGIDASRTQ